MIYPFLKYIPFGCAVCFGGDPNDSQIIGLKWGVLSLLAILLFVLSLFTAFFVNIHKRSKKFI